MGSEPLTENVYMDKVPAQLQAQIDEAERLQQMINQGQTEETPPPAENPEPEDTNSEPPAEPQAPESQTSEAPAEPESEPKGKDKKFKKLEVDPNSEETFEQRYKSLMGMYNAEVPRLHAQLKETREQVNLLAKELEDARAQQQTAQPTPDYTITDEDREAFGPDLVNLIEKAAEGKVSAYRQTEQQLRAELEMLKRRLGDVSERQVVSDQDRFKAGLAQLVPNWEQVNVDPGFLQWLQQVDPIYGIPRQAALNNAYEALDVNRVATIFNAYIGPQAQAPKANPKQELQRHVAPSTSRVSAAPTETQQSRIYTSQQVQEFYDDWRRGNISDEDAQRIESEIHAAAAEGRIR